MALLLFRKRSMVTATKPYGQEQITATGHVIHWARASETRERALPWMERAMRRGVHVLACTPDTLSIAVVAGIQAWAQHEYHLCVRLDRGAVKDHGTKKRYEHASCHDMDARYITVTLADIQES